MEESQVFFKANGFGVGQVIGNDVLPIGVGKDAHGREIQPIVHAVSPSAESGSDPSVEIFRPAPPAIRCCRVFFSLRWAMSARVATWTILHPRSSCATAICASCALCIAQLLPGSTRAMSIGVPRGKCW